MLPLDSPRWNGLKGSAGGDGTLARDLILKILEGDDSGYDELYHQSCHQFTVGEVGYAVVPHLVDIIASDPPRLSTPYATIGAFVASRAANPFSSPTIPSDLQQDYDSCCEKALPLSCQALTENHWDGFQVSELLGTVAALRGLTNLAMTLYLGIHGHGEPYCAMCGEEFDYFEERA